MALQDRPLDHAPAFHAAESNARAFTESSRARGQKPWRFSHGQWIQSFSSTLRTLSSIICSRSVRVPNRMLVEIRGTSCGMKASWHCFTEANTRTQSPSILIPYAVQVGLQPCSGEDTLTDRNL